MGGALSPAPVSHSTMSHFEVLSVAERPQGGLALGGSRNDVLVVAAAAALGLYFERSGQRCPNVRVAVPTRQHRNGDSDGNWFVPTRVEVPTSSDHPRRHVQRRRRAPGAGAARAGAAVHRGRGVDDQQAAEPDAAAGAEGAGRRRRPRRVGDPRASGRADDLRRQVEAAYPIGPRLGTPLNVTAFGSRDGLDVGIALDPGAITDPEASASASSRPSGGWCPPSSPPPSRSDPSRKSSGRGDASPRPPRDSSTRFDERTSRCPDTRPCGRGRSSSSCSAW